MLPNVTPSLERSRLNPVSLLELSLHDRLILEAEAAPALRFVGATGIAVDVGVAVGVGVSVGLGVGVSVGVGLAVGVGVGVGVPVLLTRIMLPIEGTPFPFKMKSM